jgi:hypothetical protein
MAAPWGGWVAVELSILVYSQALSGRAGMFGKAMFSRAWPSASEARFVVSANGFELGQAEVRAGLDGK